MKHTDIAIIGGGLASSTAVTMLGRAGIAMVLIDPHEVYRFDFRVEKLNGDAQLERFSRTGIADSELRQAIHDGENGSRDSASSWTSAQPACPRSRRFCQHRLGGRWLRRPVTPAIAQGPQAFVGQQPTGLDPVAQRFAGPDIEEHVDHVAAAGP